MGHPNLPPSKRTPRRSRLLDLISAAFFAAVLVFFLFVFTPAGRQSQMQPAANPWQRNRIAALVEVGREGVIETCPAEVVDHMPCEDPRRNSQLSREMNFYRERHCPPPEETPLCLVPNPEGYRVPVRWPESLNKVVEFASV